MKKDWDIDITPHLSNERLKIVNSHLNKVCLCKKGEKACRYIALTAKLGYLCVKNTPLKPLIDQEVESNPHWQAKGNNCDGFK